jgi:D-sedoheptulose 7-phosphate isomerase
VTPLSGAPDTVADLFERRVAPLEALAANPAPVADACLAMAVRFDRGGKLIVFGNGGPSTDAQHVAVEFVHPVITGKRALPALSLTTDVATVTGIAEQNGFADVFAHQLQFLGEPADIALGISTDGCDPNVRTALRTARERRMLTVALVGGDGGEIAAQGLADHVLCAQATDPQVVKEVHVTTYHILWELVHVFLEQPGLFAPEVIA